MDHDLATQPEPSGPLTEFESSTSQEVCLDCLAPSVLEQPRKLRLNAAQWQTLQALADGDASTCADRQAVGMGRLTSHGLVTTDEKGCVCLTLTGIERLKQGR